MPNIPTRFGPNVLREIVLHSVLHFPQFRHASQHLPDVRNRKEGSGHQVARVKGRHGCQILHSRLVTDVLSLHVRQRFLDKFRQAQIGDHPVGSRGNHPLKAIYSHIRHGGAHRFAAKCQPSKPVPSEHYASRA